MDSLQPNSILDPSESQTMWLRTFIPVFAAVAIVFLACPHLAAAQNDARTDHHFRLGFGGFFAHTDLPRHTTDFGSAQGKFTRTLAVRIGVDPVGEWAGSPGFIDLSIALETDVDWENGGNTTSATIFTPTVGLMRDHGIASGSRVFGKVGAGAHLIVFSYGACVPEDPTCALYSGNDLDPALQLSGGAEFDVGGIPLWVEAGSFLSTFNFSGGEAVQAFTTLLVGITL